VVALFIDSTFFLLFSFCFLQKKNKASVSDAPAAGPVKFNIASPTASSSSSSAVPPPTAASTVEEVVAIVQEEQSAPASDSAASSVPAGSGEVAAGMKVCSACNQAKSKKDDFSSAQGKKPNGKCKACVV
jgi:uncharacterized protein (DUF2342 family)